MYDRNLSERAGMTRIERQVEGWHDMKRGISRASSKDLEWLKGWDAANKGYVLDDRVMRNILCNVRAI
jgi:hypothetical protein